MSDDLVWRAPTTEDIRAITQLATTCDAIYGTLEITLIDDLAKRLQRESHYDQFSRVILLGNTIIAAGWTSFSYAVSEDRAPMTAFALPEHSELFEPVMLWLCENYAGASDPAVIPRAERVLALTTADVPANQLAVYDALGFERFYVELEMLRNTQAVGPTTAEIEIRPWTAQLHPQIRDVYNAAFAERGFEGYSDEQWPRAFAPEDVAARYTFVAFRAESITGLVFGGAADRIGWIDSIGVVPTHIGRGVATALIAGAIDAFRDAGIEKVGLRVNEDNARALRLYEHLGFTRTRKHVVYRREVPAER